MQLLGLQEKLSKSIIETAKRHKVSDIKGEVDCCVTSMRFVKTQGKHSQVIAKKPCYPRYLIAPSWDLDQTLEDKCVLKPEFLNTVLIGSLDNIF
jgi:hypothetical protein